VQAALDDHLAHLGETIARPPAPADAGPLRVTGHGPARRAPVLGEFHGRAVITCLHRASPVALRTAHGVAVLNHADAQNLLCNLVDMEPNAVEAGLSELTAIGLLSEGRFRHESVRQSILGTVAPPELTELHSRAAELMHDAGESNQAVAEHVIAAGRASSPWAIEVLYGTARAAASRHDVEFARACLELAAWSTTNEDERTRAYAKLLDVMWRVDSKGAEPHVAALTSAMQDGRLEAGQIVSLVKHELWCGRIDSAANALTWLRPLLGDPEVAASPSVRILQCWLAHAFPALASLLPPACTGPARADGGRHALLDEIDARLCAADALLRVLSNRPVQDRLSDVRGVLQSHLCYELRFESVHTALMALLYSGQVNEAAEWCDFYLAEAARRRWSPCHCVLLAMRAEISLRQGDLVSAADQAGKAVALFGERRWGTVSELPLATLLTALVRLGRMDEAAALARRPVPMGFLTSRAGLTYRLALGRFKLAGGDARGALEELAVCGRMAGSWGLDAPTLVPWREVAAEAALRMGDLKKAGELLHEHLELIGEGFPRLRGAALRLLADTLSDPVERRKMLVEAVELLRADGGGYELALAMFDLAAVNGLLGRTRQARMETRLAHEVAKHCGAAVPARAVPAMSAAAVAGAGTGTGAAVVEKPVGLSLAERRVAQMAARGYTNREIAEQLFITRSTVEQHLTRVFRKLKVRQREELPPSMGLLEPDPT
jgi:DNA-binding CsgD family transcriptional regulator